MPLSSYKILRQVQLHETDLGGLMHHPNYFLWMEQAEYELFEAVGEPVVGPLNDKMQGSGWPRARVSMSFLKPLHYRDKVEVCLKIKRIRSAAIEYETEFYRLGETRELVASGAHTSVCCLYDATGQTDPLIVPASEDFLNKIAECKE